MRYETLKRRAEEYARDELGWPVARAIETTATGEDGSGCAVRVHAGESEEQLESPANRLDFAIVFNGWGDVIADAEQVSDYFDDAPPEEEWLATLRDDLRERRQGLLDEYRDFDEVDVDPRFEALAVFIWTESTFETLLEEDPAAARQAIDALESEGPA